MTTIPDEERVRREVEEIAARPSAQRELLAELLVTLRRLSADVAAIRRDLRALALATTEGASASVRPAGSWREADSCWMAGRVAGVSAVVVADGTGRGGPNGR